MSLQLSGCWEISQREEGERIADLREEDDERRECAHVVHVEGGGGGAHLHMTVYRCVVCVCVIINSCCAERRRCLRLSKQRKTFAL